MSRVRALDADHDWLFGKGQNDYLTANAAVVQNINTRLLSFLGDCFFDQGAGLDWWNYNGSKDTVVVNLAVSAVILNTADVTGLLQLSINLSQDRLLTVIYVANSTYSKTTGTFQYDLNGIG